VSERAVLQLAQAIENYVPVGYASIKLPCAAHKRPAQTPRIAPAAMIKGPALVWMLVALVLHFSQLTSAK
jgi:hypothetical protein